MEKITEESTTNSANQKRKMQRKKGIEGYHCYLAELEHKPPEVGPMNLTQSPEHILVFRNSRKE